MICKGRGQLRHVRSDAILSGKLQLEMGKSCCAVEIIDATRAVAYNSTVFHEPCEKEAVNSCCVKKELDTK